MRTITLNLKVTVQIPEYDEEGKPRWEEDQSLEEVTVTVDSNGDRISVDPESFGDIRRWDLLPEEENFTLNLEFGYN